MRWVQERVDASIDDVIERGLPDEFFRIRTAMAFGRLLEFQLDVLMTALAKIMPEGLLN